jgi:Fe2+ transport system protein FeoA
MASSVSFPIPDPSPSSCARLGSSAASDRGTTGGSLEVPLASIPLGTHARVVRLDLDDELRDWLAAVGIGVGERIVVLRRAVFGGPLHLRTGTGGEFALNRALARMILISVEEEESAA